MSKKKQKIFKLFVVLVFIISLLAGARYANSVELLNKINITQQQIYKDVLSAYTSN